MEEQQKQPMQKEAIKQGKKTKEQELEIKLLALEAEKKDLVETLQRLQAEFENYKKRIEKEKPQLLFLGKARAISELLAVLDSFGAAEQKLKKEHKQDSGLGLLHKQFAEAMQRLGLKEIKTTGEKFNHETMDCVMQESEKEKPDGIVLEELQKGFALDGMVLRHAKVKVNKTWEKKAENPAQCAEKKEEKKAC